MYRNPNEITHTFIPTIAVLEEMRTYLMVQEQINTILFGVTYQKREDFFYDEKFEALIEALTNEEDSNGFRLFNHFF